MIKNCLIKIKSTSHILKPPGFIKGLKLTKNDQSFLFLFSTAAHKRRDCWLKLWWGLFHWQLGLNYFLGISASYHYNLLDWIGLIDAFQKFLLELSRIKNHKTSLHKLCRQFQPCLWCQCKFLSVYPPKI